MRYISVFLLFASAAAAQNAWRYVQPKPTRVVAMEWRKVLESPHSAELRRQLPSDAAGALGAINIIEGIDRLVLANDDAGPLIVLEGNFDLTALKGSAASEGAVVKPYRSAELVVPAEPEDDDVVMALISGKHLLLGYEDALMRAIDRAPSVRPVNPAVGFDLWMSSPATTVGWQLGDKLRVFRDGSWDAPVDRNAERPPDLGGKIRIYGLEEGVREIELGKSKQ